MKALLSFIETSSFTARMLELLSDEDYAKLQWLLINHPEAGDLIVGGGGIRKIRWGIAGRGKRGGARVIYYWADARGEIFMLAIYAKNEKADLADDELRELKKIVEAWLQ